MSVESCSGDGSGRVSSENWTTRAGVGSMATTTRSMAAGGGCDSRSSSASVRSVRASRIGVGSCSDRSCTRARLVCHRATSRVDRDARAARRRRGRAARDAPRAAPADGPARRTAARAPRSATRDRAPARTAPRARPARAEPDLHHARAAATARPPVPAEPPHRRTATPPDRRACADPSGGMSRSNSVSGVGDRAIAGSAMRREQRDAAAGRALRLRCLAQ